MAYIDQRTDRSGAVLVKIANRLSDRELAERVLNVFFDPERDRSSQGLLKTAEDVLLSSVYFEGQREALAPKEAERVAEKLAAYRVLHGIDEDFTFRARLRKTASAKPLIKIAGDVAVNGKESLDRAMRSFTDAYRGMTGGERSAYAKGFMKAAAELSAEPTELVRLHAEDGVAARHDIADRLRMHKSAGILCGRGDGADWDFLIDSVQKSELDDAGLSKLASAVDALDAAYGLRETRYGKGLPTGHETVFMLKQAEEDGDKGDALPDKAAVTALYGEDALDAVEDENGAIDKTRLKEVMRLFGQSPEQESPNGGYGK